jgi:hypothetical protein
MAFPFVLIVREGRRAGLFRMGRLHKILGPGLHFTLPLIDSAQMVDLSAQVPGWQGYLPRQLEAKVRSLLLGGEVPVRQERKEGAPSTDQASLANWLLARASKDTGVALDNDELARKRMMEAALRALEELSQEGRAEVNLPFIAAGADGPRHFHVDLDRDQLREILRDAHNLA